jgi:hypothetical protein
MRSHARSLAIRASSCAPAAVHAAHVSTDAQCHSATASPSARRGAPCSSMLARLGACGAHVDGVQIHGLAIVARPKAKTEPLVVGDNVRVDGLKVRADAQRSATGGGHTCGSIPAGIHGLLDR